MKQIKTLLAIAAMGIIMAGCNTTKKSQQEPMLPHDRENISNNKSVQSYTSEELKHGVVKGDWSIQEVMGQEAVGEKAPFLKFVQNEKRVYGNNGCNTLNATYVYNAADSTIRFDNMASTMMACAKEGITDMQINQALAKTRYYSWKIQGSDYYLYLYDTTRRPLMTLMHQNFDFLNGTWDVKAIGDKKIDNPDMKLVIDVDEGKLHGNTGCNILNGKMDINMDEANSISFSAIATTRMACPPEMNHETELLVALEDASAAKPVSADKVLLFNSQGKQVLELQRTTDE